MVRLAVLALLAFKARQKASTWALPSTTRSSQIVQPWMPHTVSSVARQDATTLRQGGFGLGSPSRHRVRGLLRPIEEVRPLACQGLPAPEGLPAQNYCGLLILRHLLPGHQSLWVCRTLG